MTYKDFNKKALNFYLSRANSAFFTFSIDHSELMFILTNDRIPLFRRLESNWTLLLKEDEGIPQYFGLIALQCYAGTRMEDDEVISERVYNARLLQVLQLEGIDVQSLYKDGNSDNPAQELIWCAAREYLLKIHGLRLKIPEPRVFSRRYVQFPISQILLNTEDLKQFTVFFAEHLIADENIPYQLFREMLLRWIPGRVTARCVRVLSDEDKREKCLEQVFNYYQRWDGNIYKKDDPNKNAQNITVKHADSKGRILLSVFDGHPEFIFDNESIDPHQVLQLKNYFYFHKGVLLFNPIPDYDDDFEDSRLLIKSDCEYYILISRSYDQNLFSYLECCCLSKTYFPSGAWLFRFKVDDHIPYCLRKYFYLINPAQLHSGIKLNRTNAFLKGFGPSIEYDRLFRVIYNSHPVIYNPETAETGKYIVRTNDYRDVIFYIEDSPKEIFITSSNKGWNLFNLSVSDAPGMEGCLIKSFPSGKIHPVREWINIQTSSSFNIKNQQSNILLRILQNAGIQKYKNKGCT
ncbi:hypothetical protein A3860_26730 [Niastella vici]|uniref:Uncharacterized protein n=1 Tax=Niastella vici TaxID=1703345 RepID=A0A1V9FX42_9BACT|nr:hypothetical protein [Niastella vici]OQP62907.1 hypothetical protein A3860_26730 [Niastella vici]